MAPVPLHVYLFQRPSSAWRFCDEFAPRRVPDLDADGRHGDLARPGGHVQAEARGGTRDAAARSTALVPRRMTTRGRSLTVTAQRRPPGDGRARALVGAPALDLGSCAASDGGRVRHPRDRTAIESWSTERGRYSGPVGSGVDTAGTASLRSRRAGSSGARAVSSRVPAIMPARTPAGRDQQMRPFCFSGV